MKNNTRTATRSAATITPKLSVRVVANVPQEKHQPPQTLEQLFAEWNGGSSERKRSPITFEELIKDWEGVVPDKLEWWDKMKPRGKELL